MSSVVKMEKVVFRVLLALVVLALLMSAVGSVASAAEPVAAPVAATLPAGGGWTAYTFHYAGDNSNLAIIATYSATDLAMHMPENAIALELYSPDAPPPASVPVLSAVYKDFNQNALTLNSDVAGDYTLIVYNWDKESAAQVALTTLNTDEDFPGPALEMVSSMPTAAPAKEVTPALVPVKASLPVAGGWAAYTFNYAGDSSEVEVVLTYSAPDPGMLMPENAVTLELYTPGAPPPASLPLCTAVITGVSEQSLMVQSDTAGMYTIIVHNWDPDHPVNVTLTTRHVGTNMPGPALETVSAAT